MPRELYTYSGSPPVNLRLHWVHATLAAVNRSVRLRKGAFRVLVRRVNGCSIGEDADGTYFSKPKGERQSLWELCIACPVGEGATSALPRAKCQMLHAKLPNPLEPVEL